MSRERHALLAHWIAQKKLADRELEEAEGELDLWFGRATLALNKGEVTLARAAKDRADDAELRVRSAAARCREVEAELRGARETRADPSQDEAADARIRAQHAAEEFKKLGIDPQFAELEARAQSGQLRGPDGGASEVQGEDVSERGAERRRALDEADELLDAPLGTPEDE